MKELVIPIGRERLAACLHVPRAPRGAVVFVHGSGVDRYDARDGQVAGVDRWQRVAHQSWSEAQIDDVAAFLNGRFYKLPCKLPRCRGG